MKIASFALFTKCFNVIPMFKLHKNSEIFKNIFLLILLRFHMVHFDYFVNGVRLSEAEGPAHIFHPKW